MPMNSVTVETLLTLQCQYQVFIYSFHKHEYWRPSCALRHCSLPARNRTDAGLKMLLLYQCRGSSNEDSARKYKCQSPCHVRLFATPRTVARLAPPSMEFSRQENWSGLPFLSLGDLPDPGIKPGSPALQVEFYHLSHQGHPNKAQVCAKENAFECGLIFSNHELPILFLCYLF